MTEVSKRAWAKFQRIKKKLNLIAKINIINKHFKQFGTALYMPKNYK